MSAADLLLSEGLTICASFGGANYAAFCAGYWRQCEGCAFYQRDNVFFCGKWNAVFYDSPVVEVVSGLR